MIVGDNMKINTIIIINNECEKILMPALPLCFHTRNKIEIKIHKNLSIRVDNIEAREEVLEKLINDIMNAEILYKVINNLKRIAHSLLVDNNFTYIQDKFGYSYLVDRRCTNALANIQIKPTCEFFFRPTFFTIDITYHCNLKCSYCVRRLIHDRQQVIDLSILESILDFIIELSTIFNLDRIYVQPYGGEPTLYNNLIFFIDDYLRDALGKHKYKIVVETNGVGIQDESIAKEYYERHIGVGLSIDGPRHIHDLQRGRGSYDIAIRALNSLVNAGYKKEEIGAISVITKYSVEHIDDIVNHIIEDLGLTVVHLNYPITYNRSLIPSPERFAEKLISMFENIISKYIHVKVRPLTEFLLSLLIGKSFSVCYQYDGCYAGMAMLAFDTQGNIYPCPELVTTTKYRLGNVKQIKNPKHIISNVKIFRSKRCNMIVQSNLREILPGKGFGCIAFDERLGTHLQKKLYLHLTTKILSKIVNDTSFRRNLEKYLASTLERYLYSKKEG